MCIFVPLEKRKPSEMNYLMVGIGGMSGSVLRYWIGTVVVNLWGPMRFPAATLIVNVTGSFLIGMAMAYLLRTETGGGHYYFLAVVGFCGGFTTFSTFSLEAMNLFKAGDFALGLLYILLSVVVCCLAVWLGMSIISR